MEFLCSWVARSVCGGDQEAWNACDRQWELLGEAV